MPGNSSTFSDRELERYARHIIMREIGGPGQKRLRGARVLAITDSHASPIAEDAWQVLKIPMNGPQLMPSLSTAFVAVEVLLAAMAARSDTAADNIAKHEARIRDYGGYIALK